MFRALSASALLVLSAYALAQEYRHDVVSRFAGVTARADYVLAVDASKSMVPVVAEMRKAVANLVAQLPENDHLSILRFANDASEYLPDRTIKNQTRQALITDVQNLADPTGTHTDLGAGIERAIRELARPDFGDVQFLFFLSDFCHDPPPDSPWFGERSWRKGKYLCRDIKNLRQLENKARDALAGHRVRVIVLRLPGSDEEGLRAFKAVFPGVFEVDLAQTTLEEYFARFQKEVVFEKVAVLAREEVEKGGMVVSLEETDIRLEPGGERSLNIVVKNTMPHLDARANWKFLSLFVDAGLEVAAADAEVVVPAAGSVNIPITLRSTACAEKPCGGAELAKTAKWTLNMEATAEPALGLRQLLVTPTLPQIEQPMAVTARWTCITPQWVCTATAAGIGGLGFLTGLGALAFVLRRRPARFCGTLKIEEIGFGRKSLLASRGLNEIKKNFVTIGSASDCDLRVEGRGLAHMHARLIAKRKGLFGSTTVFTLEVFGLIRCLGRRYEPGERVMVKPGDSFEIGDGQLRVTWER